MAAGDVSVELSSQSARKAPFNDGTRSGGVTISDGAMVFDGANGHFTGGNIGLNHTSIRTFSTWVNVNSLASAQFIQSFELGGAYRGIFNIETNGKLRLELTATTNGIRFFSTNTLATGNWYHVAYVVNESINLSGGVSTNIVELYINGNKEIISTSSIGGSATATTNLFIARVTTNYLNGSLGSTQMFNKILSPTEISQIYNAGKDAYSPVTNGLVAQYSGRDFSGTEALPIKIYDTASLNKNIINPTIVETALKKLRKSANDKFLLDEINNSIMVAHIEEA
jgi:hypothetical protein